MKKVVIVQRILPHYRIPFFDVLASDLKSKDIDLCLLYGQELKGTVPVTVDIDRNWAKKIKNNYFSIGGIEVVWQPIIKEIKEADLIVIEQANRLVVNYILLLLRVFLGKKIAFWGHGKNFQTNKKRFFESWKRWISAKVDWWFAYTKEGVDIVSELPFPKGKITEVKNSIDTSSLISEMKNITLQDKLNLKEKYNINSENVGIYCGGLYKEKKIGFLLESCNVIRKAVPDFTLLVIGDGPERNLVEEFAKENTWVNCLGVITGRDRVPFFSISKISLMPGLMGLAVLDSFALQTPIVTTQILEHSPEFDYLINGVNGVVTEHDIEKYSNAVIALLSDNDYVSKITKGCRQESENYTIEIMSSSFSQGIASALS